MYRFLRSLLFLLPAETAHHLGIRVLSVLGVFVGICRRLRTRILERVARTADGVSLRTRIGPLELEHPLMLAAGLDKDARAVHGLFALGFSAVEIGTVTPRPQPGNPLPRLFRLPEHEALINRMGFNNEGALAAANRLRALSWRPGPVGGNIGKNKATPIEHAMDDYLLCVDELGPVVDYVVVNASSPNTPGLRTLQEPEALEQLLLAVRSRMDLVARGKPLLLKIAPDLGPEAVDAIVEVALRCRIDGLIATNTTITRPVDDPRASEAGGLSGRPMAALATSVIARARVKAGDRLPIIGVGGIVDAQEAYRKIRAGASAVQLYTGFIYGGPGTVRRMLPELAALLKKDGFSAVEDAVGVDAQAIVEREVHRREANDG
ncbi:MAG: quinone-dependent dihydroorotate dehydrogenase [Myxococcaceae bacterium]|nr:quinone-dependent dihydroorotate dehydrogenase [Myxococcaceae bacterium]